MFALAAEPAERFLARVERTCWPSQAAPGDVEAGLAAAAPGRGQPPAAPTRAAAAPRRPRPGGAGPRRSGSSPARPARSPLSGASRLARGPGELDRAEEDRVDWAMLDDRTEPFLQDQAATPVEASGAAHERDYLRSEGLLHLGRLPTRGLRPRSVVAAALKTSNRDARRCAGLFRSGALSGSAPRSNALGAVGIRSMVAKDHSKSPLQLWLACHRAPERVRSSPGVPTRGSRRQCRRLHGFAGPSGRRRARRGCRRR